MARGKQQIRWISPFIGKWEIKVSLTISFEFDKATPDIFRTENQGKNGAYLKRYAHVRK